MADTKYVTAPEHTSVRVALWRALHVELDPAPHVFHDQLGAKLVGEDNWRSRPDMDPSFSRPMRASIVGRARFIEDLLHERVKQGANQYVILGAGLDTFAQRHSELSGQLQVFEVDRPGPQAWKQKRLQEIGQAQKLWPHFVPVDFETGQSWWDELISGGMDIRRAAVFSSTGVSLYLTKEANLETLKQIARLPSGTIFAMTFMLALELLSTTERASMEFVMEKAAESGTPFLSLFTPAEILQFASKAGFKHSKVVTGEDLYQRYFSQRSDGLRAGQAEAFLLAMT